MRNPDASGRGEGSDDRFHVKDNDIHSSILLDE
jgi:hypothetical protein